MTDSKIYKTWIHDEVMTKVYGGLFNKTIAESTDYLEGEIKLDIFNLKIYCKINSK